MFLLQSDRSLSWVLRLCAAACSIIVVLIVTFLLVKSLPALNNIGLYNFLFDGSWFPLEQQYNLTPMILGSVMVTGVALLLAVPLGILSAVFCLYYAPALLSAAYYRVIELLAGIPSVVFGLWGLVTLVPLISSWQGPGTSVLAASIVLALMVLPTVTILSHAALKALPAQYVHAASALGLSRASSIFSVYLPAAKSGIGTAVILSTGRAIGETMAVMMVAGNVVQVPAGLFEPVRTLTANIALEMSYALGDHQSALFFSGLMLLLLVVGFVILAMFVQGHHTRVQGTA